LILFPFLDRRDPACPRVFAHSIYPPFNEVIKMAERRRLVSGIARTIAFPAALVLHACGGGGAAARIPDLTTRQIQVYQQQPQSQVIKFPLPTAHAGPTALTLGSDSNYWVTEGAVGKIARVTNLGSIAEFAFTRSTSPSYVSLGGGSPAAVWALDSKNAILSDVTPTGLVTEGSLAAGSSPQQVFDGTGGEIWVTEANANAVVQTTSTNFTKKPPVFKAFSLPAGSEPYALVQGPDKNMWVTEPGTGSIAEIPYSGGTITQYALPAGRVPTTIVSDAGYLWFGEAGPSGTAYLARLSTAGVLTEYPVPGNAVPEYLADGPLSGIWYSTSTAQLAYAVIGTKVTFEPAVATIGSVVPIIKGKDNNIWYPDPSNNAADVYVVYPLTVTSSSIGFTAVAQTQSFSVAETHFTGTFTAASSNPSVASISPASGKTFTVVANAAGTATITISDSASYPQSGNGTTISVTVTTTSISIDEASR
jgi:streptogramin lyase